MHLVVLVVLVVSGASWEGPLSLRKAMTFGISFGLTVAWATSFLAVRPRVRTLLLGLFAAVSVVETALVSMQAWRGVPSHFNFETGFDTAVSMTLAAGGGVIIVVAIGFAAAALVGVGAIAPSMRVGAARGVLVAPRRVGDGGGDDRDGRAWSGARSPDMGCSR